MLVDCRLHDYRPTASRRTNRAWSHGRATSGVLTLSIKDRPSPSGDNGDSRERIVEMQRARILQAMTDIVADRGLYGTTIAASAVTVALTR